MAGGGEHRRRRKTAGLDADCLREHNRCMSRTANKGSRLRAEIARALCAVEAGSPSGAVLDGLLQRVRDPRDRALATEILYGTLRRAPALLSRIEPKLRRGRQRTAPEVIWVLASACYQRWCLERVPSHAAVSTAVDAARALKGPGAAKMVNAILRALPEEQPIRAEDCYPRWIARAFEDLGPELAPRAPEAYLRPAPQVVRLRGASLAEIGEAARLPLARRITDSGPRRSAREVIAQDEASQAVAGAAVELARAVGRRILDACAGRGVKTAAIHDAFREAEVQAVDRDSLKLRQARELVFGLRTHTGDLSAGLPVPERAFDLVLLDAPCTGLGTLRRHPEIRLLRTARHLRSLVQLQARILEQCARAVAPGGVLLYAVCTFTAAEGRDQLARFLASPGGADFSMRPMPAPPVPGWAQADGSWCTWDDPVEVAAPADTFWAGCLVRRS